MRKKSYYKIKFCLLEPLSLGSGDNRYSDRDLLRNSKGTPFIPGSSLCGVYRTCLDQKTADRYFGYVRKVDKANEVHAISESSVKVYDAVLTGSYRTSFRDSVGLDLYKTAKDEAKFDFELVEPGAVFVTYLEQDFLDHEDVDIKGNLDYKEVDIGEKIITAYDAGQIKFGHKTMRGYGSVVLEGVWKKSFDLEKKSELEDWLKFDMYAPNAFGKDDIYQSVSKVESENAVKTAVIELDLEQAGGLSIRRYTTDPGIETEEKNKQSASDYTQMFYGKDSKDGHTEEVPYIPGTSWAGAFRHRIRELLPEEKQEDVIHNYFGQAAGTVKEKSKIRFSESQIKGAFSKTITRTAIDRFTGGVSDKALYTERSFFGGTTTLRISFPVDPNRPDKCWNRVLAATVTDLDEGFLAVGGLTSVGRGLFRVKVCKLNDQEIYKIEEKKVSKTEGSEISPELYKRLVTELDNMCRENENGKEARNE